MDFSIREALPGDAEDVHDMIKELCVYEKTSLNQVETTPKELIEDGLRSQDYFRCLIAEVNTQTTASTEKNAEQVSGNSPSRKVAGFALYYFGYSTWKGKLIYLEDLFVRPECRGNGIGTAFFKRLGKIAVEKKCCRIMFVCLDWNTSAKEFYASIEAEEQPEWRLFYFKNENIQKFLSNRT